MKNQNQSLTLSFPFSFSSLLLLLHTSPSSLPPSLSRTADVANDINSQALSSSTCTTKYHDVGKIICHFWTRSLYPTFPIPSSPLPMIFFSPSKACGAREASHVCLRLVCWLGYFARGMYHPNELSLIIEERKGRNIILCILFVCTLMDERCLIGD